MKKLLPILALAACAAPPAAAPREPRDEVVPWLRANLVPLRTDDPAAPLDDLAPMKRIVGDARVVGLGEATHGTREFFRLKHRILAYLASAMGPCTLAMEADFADGLAIDRYVQGEDGDLRAAVEKLYLVWRTQEIAELLAWMRAWNATHAQKVHFAGFDAQSAKSALRDVRAYLARVDAADKAPDTSALEADGYAALPESTRAPIRASLAHLLEQLDQARADYSRRSSDAAWTFARQELVTAMQAERVAGAQSGRERFVARDQSMADNVRWIADRGGRVAAWAHNGHILRPGGAPTMGARLRDALGSGYVAVGLFFDDGAFQTFDFSGGNFRWKETTLGPTASDSATATMARTGVPLFALDLRAQPQPVAVTRWLATEHAVREVGHTFETEAKATRGANLSEEFDAAIFVQHTTRARPFRAPRRTASRSPWTRPGPRSSSRSAGNHGASRLQRAPP